MSAHLIITINTQTLQVEAARILSGGVEGLGGAGKNLAFAEVLHVSWVGLSFAECENRLLECIADTYESSPLQWVVPLLLKNREIPIRRGKTLLSERKGLWRSGGYDEYCRLMYRLWVLAGEPTMAGM